MSNEFAHAFLVILNYFDMPHGALRSERTLFLVNPMQKPCSAQGNQTKIHLKTLRRARFLHPNS